MQYKIPFIKPNFPKFEDLAQDYSKIVENNWYTNFGPFEAEFSKSCGLYINAYATSISNCTLGLEAAISILFDKSKKSVIIPSFTFAAGAEAIIRGGFTPIFIDIEESNLQPSINQASALLSERDDIAGILLCNIFGVGNTQVDAWEKLAAEYQLPLVIDSAAGFGSKYSDDEKIGARGDCEIFSMHATKPFAIGEGGMVTSKNKEFIQKVKSWQNFGFGSDRNVAQIGTNAKLQEINAAIGLRQLSRFGDRLDSRRKTLQLYKNTLSDLGVSFQDNDERSTVAFASMIMPDKDTADKTYTHLWESGVEVKRYYAPLHLQAEIVKYAELPVSLSVTEEVAGRILSLPVHDFMSEDDVNLVANAVREGVEK